MIFRIRVRKGGWKLKRIWGDIKFQKKFQFQGVSFSELVVLYIKQDGNEDRQVTTFQIF